MLTRFCPVGCKFCFFKSGPVFKQASHEDHFTPDGLENFIDFCNDINLGYLLVSGGGEPMMERKSVLRIIKDEDAIPTAELLNITYKKPELFQEVLASVNTKIAHDKLSLTTQQVINCVQEVYVHSLQKKLNTADPVFLDWFIIAMNN